MSATLFQTKLAPYSSYVVGASCREGLLPEASFWDTTDPYYYLRVDRRQTVATTRSSAGKDHKTGQEHDTKQPFRELGEALLEARFPQAKIDRQWSGQVIETNDGLPYIGETAERQFVATGFAGNGMTFGTLAAMMACDAVLGARQPVAGPVFGRAARSSAAARGTISRRTSTIPTTSSGTGWRRPEGKSTEEVAPRRGQDPEARRQARRLLIATSDGKLTTVSAVCTHMGCIVHWNEAEQDLGLPLPRLAVPSNGRSPGRAGRDPFGASLEVGLRSSRVLRRGPRVKFRVLC